MNLWSPEAPAMDGMKISDRRKSLILIRISQTCDVRDDV